MEPVMAVPLGPDRAGVPLLAHEYFSGIDQFLGGLSRFGGSKLEERHIHRLICGVCDDAFYLVASAEYEKEGACACQNNNFFLHWFQILDGYIYIDA